MGRGPCCEKVGLKKGAWTREEDEILKKFVLRYGHGNWRTLPQRAGLLRCGKSCRFRWTNYLNPKVRRGNYSKEEEETIIKLHEQLGNRWSAIAAKLPGRTDNEIKNVWYTHLKKRAVVKQEAASQVMSRCPSIETWGGSNTFISVIDDATNSSCFSSTEITIYDIPICEGLETSRDMVSSQQELSEGNFSCIRNSTLPSLEDSLYDSICNDLSSNLPPEFHGSVWPETLFIQSAEEDYESQSSHEELPWACCDNIWSFFE